MKLKKVDVSLGHRRLDLVNHYFEYMSYEVSRMAISRLARDYSILDFIFLAGSDEIEKS